MLSFLGLESSIKKKRSLFTPVNNWIIVRKLNSQRCGQHFLIQNTDSGEVLMKKTVSKDSEKKAKGLKESLELKINNQHAHVLKIHDFDVDIQTDFCSKMFYFSIYYDYPERDLELMLSSQIHSSGACSGENLLKIAYNTMSGLLHLQGLPKNRDAGLLQLDRVYYNPESNLYRVVENINDIRLFDFYFNLTISRSASAIFSPTCLKKKPLINKKFDLSKIDCFNLGLILLCFGVNEFPEVFYKKNHKEMNRPLLEAKKMVFLEKYQKYSFLCDILQDLLEFDLAARLSLSEIIQKYPKHTRLRDYQSSLQSIGVRSEVNPKPLTSNPQNFNNVYKNSKYTLFQFLYIKKVNKRFPNEAE